MSNIQALATRHRELSEEISTIKKEQTAIEEVMREAAEPLWKSKIADAGKTHGEFKIIVEGEPLKCAATKTVKWDSDALKEVAKKLSAADLNEIFQLTLSVKEDTFNDLTEMGHPLLPEIVMARTVKLSNFTAKPYGSAAA